VALKASLLKIPDDAQRYISFIKFVVEI